MVDFIIVSFFVEFGILSSFRNTIRYVSRVQLECSWLPCISSHKKAERREKCHCAGKT